MPYSVWSAQIKVSVDRNPVSSDESFQITFTASESPDDDPDFSPLEQDFLILGQSQASSSSWVNGKSSKTIQWTLNVMPRQAGSLVIPSVEFGSDTSPALPILVTPPGKAPDTDSKVDEDLFLEVEAVPERPYIQSQALYTIRIYSRADVQVQGKLSEPELGDAVVERLGEDSNYNTQIKGMDYSVTERRYAIFPQKSGPMIIRPLALTAEILTRNSLSFNSFFSSQLPQTRRISSKAITLEVRPAPATFTGQHWLPAQQLDLKQQWSGNINQVKVGEPLTRTLTLQAKGATVGQLPELNPAKADGQLKVYPDQPVLQEHKKSDGLTAFREEKIALIPSKASNYTLPAIEIPWFNTHSQKMEVARIPEVTVKAVAASNVAPQPGAVPETSAVTPAKAPKNEPLSVVVQPRQYNIWLWVSILLASGWLLTLVYFLTGRSLKKPIIPAKNITENAPKDKADIRIKDSIKKLKQACLDNNAAAAKNALIEWGRQKFNAVSLGAIAVCCDARLRDEILYLNHVLYGKEAEQWTGKKLFQAFTENKAREKIAVKEDDSLEPLYHG